MKQLLNKRAPIKGLAHRSTIFIGIDVTHMQKSVAGSFMILISSHGKHIYFWKNYERKKHTELLEKDLIFDILKSASD